MMNRREALKNIALASLATAVLSGCDFSEERVEDFLVNDQLMLDAEHKDHLARISATFLPLPAGLTNNMEDQAAFILKMVNGCRSPEERQKFAAGFEQYKRLMQESRLKTGRSDPDKVVRVVESILEKQDQDEELLYFIGSVKDLSVYNLKNSEHYMTEYLNYSMLPPKYDPCAGITKA